MLETVYNDAGTRDLFLSAIRFPRLDYKKPPTFELDKISAAWKELQAAAPLFKELETYTYDLVSLGVHVLSLQCRETHEKMITAFENKNSKAFQKYSQEFKQLLIDLDKLAGSHQNYLLGSWLEDAKRWGTNESEKALFECNARRVLTLWGETTMLRDYSRRSWSGMFSSFYLPRWTMFIDEMQKSLESGKTFNEAAVTEKLVQWELSWAEKRDIFPTKPNGQIINLSKNILEKYFHSHAK